MENNINLAQTIIDTINYILESLFSSIDNKLYDLLDDLVFINSDILNDKNFENIFGTSSTNGILLIANSLLLGFILYYSIKYLMSHYTYQQMDSPFRFFIKIIIFGICMNSSFFILQFFIDFISNISIAIQNLGNTLFGKNISFSELINSININMSVDTSSINIFSLDGLIKGTLTISLLNLVLSYSLRYILIKLFVLLSPFAILSLSTPSTTWFFKTWIQNLFSLLFLQIIISFILLILFSMDYSSSNLLTKFLYIGGIYALIQANSFVRELIGGISTNISQPVQNFMKLKGG